MEHTTNTDAPIKRMRLDELIAAPYNPRKISDKALAGLTKSIERFGLVQPVIWNQRTGHVVGGHQRLKVLAAQGKTDTDVITVDLPESEEKALNVALNSPGIAGEFLQDELDQLLVEVRASDPALFDDLMLQQLATASLFDEEGLTDPDEVPEVPEEAISAEGKVYLLGRHRLMCGDATDQGAVALLLAGASPPLMVTDPPYGVEYDPAWRDSLMNNPEANTSVGKVLNDDEDDWTPAWALFPGAVAYVWHSSVHATVVHHTMIDAGFDVRAQLIWNKGRIAISRGHYHWQHEPCWYAVRKGKTANWTGDRKQSTIWDIPKNQISETGHGTQKPVECMARPIRNHGAEGDGVYDPFVGSGTTIIAAEKLKRVCFAMELSPTYVDVCRKRWAEFVFGEGCDWEDMTPEG